MNSINIYEIINDYKFKKIFDTNVFGIFGMKSNFSNNLISDIINENSSNIVQETLSEFFLKHLKSFEDLKEISLKELEDLLYPTNNWQYKAFLLKRIQSNIRPDFYGIFSKYQDYFNELIKNNLILGGINNVDSFLGKDFYKFLIHRTINRIGLIKTKYIDDSIDFIKDESDEVSKNTLVIQLLYLAIYYCKKENPICVHCPIYLTCRKKIL